MIFPVEETERNISQETEAKTNFSSSDWVLARLNNVQNTYEFSIDGKS